MKTQARSTVSLRIKGITCGGCVRSIERVLASVKGIQDMDVRVGSVSLVIDPEKFEAAVIARVLEAAGYTAEFLSEDSTQNEPSGSEALDETIAH